MPRVLQRPNDDVVDLLTPFPLSPFALFWLSVSGFHRVLLVPLSAIAVFKRAEREGKRRDEKKIGKNGILIVGVMWLD